MGGRAPTTTASQGASRVHRGANRSTLARQALEVEVAAAPSASRPSSEQRLPVQASVSARGVHTLARDEAGDQLALTDGRPHRDDLHEGWPDAAASVLVLDHEVGAPDRPGQLRLLPGESEARLEFR